jgi:hypothetical protein
VVVFNDVDHFSSARNCSVCIFCVPVVDVMSCGL